MIRNRTERFRYIQENPEISVLIIGAGINGIGTFLDLALQGIDVVLIDKNDYCRYGILFLLVRSCMGYSYHFFRYICILSLMACTYICKLLTLTLILSQ